MTYHLILWVFVILIASPFLYFISLSLQSDKEALSFPHPTILPRVIHFSNYSEAIQRAPLLRYLGNSFMYAILTTIGVILTASTAGYAITKLKFRGREFFTYIFIGTVLATPAVRAIPLYTVISRFGWVNTWQGLILPLTMTGFTLIFMRQFLVTIPNTVIEAARIDGASELRILLQIVLPLCKPALGTITIYNFLFRWNDFLWPLLVTSGDKATLTVGLASFKTSQQLVQWNIVAAACMFSLIPSFIMFMLLQRYILAGTKLTSLK